MTPDKLVQVATQAIRERFQAGELGGMEGAAKAALAAAFAALPVDEIREQARAEIRVIWPEWRPGDRERAADAASAIWIAALAREFGEPT